MKSYPELIVAALVPAPLRTDELIEAVRTTRPSASDQVVRSTVARMVTRGEVVRLTRGLYALPGTDGVAALDRREAVERVAAAIRRLIESAPAAFTAPSGYQSVPIAVIDAVYSARSRYSAVKRLVETVKARLREQHGLEDPSVEAFLDAVFTDGRTRWPRPSDDEHLIGFFGGLRWVSPGTSIPKARTVVTALCALRDRGLVEREQLRNLDVLLQLLGDVPGLGETTLRYLALLLGDDEIIKPDVWVMRWLTGAIGDPRFPAPRPPEAAQMIEEATRLAIRENPNWRIRDVDHLIWQVASGRQRSSTGKVRVNRGQLAGGTHPGTGRVALRERVEPGALVDWKPYRRRRTLEKWHGAALAIDGGRVRVRWTETDATRATHLTSDETLTVPFEHWLPLDDVVPCTEGDRHPTRFEPSPGDVVDWDPRRRTRQQRHGSVVAIEGNPPMALVRWEEKASAGYALEAGDLELLQVAELTPCRGGRRCPIRHVAHASLEEAAVEHS